MPLLLFAPLHVNTSGIRRVAAWYTKNNVVVFSARASSVFLCFARLQPDCCYGWNKTTVQSAERPLFTTVIVSDPGSTRAGLVWAVTARWLRTVCCQSTRQPWTQTWQPVHPLKAISTSLLPRLESGQWPFILLLLSIFPSCVCFIFFHYYTSFSLLQHPVFVQPLSWPFQKLPPLWSLPSSSSSSSSSSSQQSVSFHHLALRCVHRAFAATCVHTNMCVYLRVCLGLFILLWDLWREENPGSVIIT